MSHYFELKFATELCVIYLDIQLNNHVPRSPISKFYLAVMKKNWGVTFLHGCKI